MIKLRDIGKKFGTQLVFKEVNIDGQPGDFIGITGKTGCGKSTLMNIISGYENADVGSNYLYQKKYRDFSSNEINFLRNKKIAFLFQSYNLIGELSIYENLKLSMNLSLFSSKKIDEYLDKVGMLEYKHKKVNKLSGGQKQRIALLRAVIKDFDILICDEPTGNLDDRNATTIMELIKELCADKVVIMVTHKKSLANKYFNKVYEYDYDQSTFVLVKENQNKEFETTLDYKKVNISLLGTILHSLKRLFILKLYNLALLLFLALFIVSYANTLVLSGDKYEDMILSHEAKLNPLQDIGGYFESEFNVDEIEANELIDFVGTSYEFSGSVKLYEEEYEYLNTSLFSALKLISIEGDDISYLFMNNGLEPCPYVVPSFQKLKLSTIDFETFPHRSIVYGRMPESDYEIIIDVSTLIEKFPEFRFRYSEYLNGNLTLEQLYHVASSKHVEFYQVSAPELNRETKQTEQTIRLMKFKIVGLIDSQLLSKDVKGIYFSRNAIELIKSGLGNVVDLNEYDGGRYNYSSPIYLSAEGNVIYKSDPSELTHDEVSNYLGDNFVYNREQLANIESSYLNVRTMVDFNFFLGTLSLVIFFVAFLTLLIYTFSHYKYDIALYRSLGYSNLNVSAILGINVVVTAFIGYLVALIVNQAYLFEILGYESDLKTLATNNLIVGLVISIAMILVVNFTYVNRYNKKPINSII